MIQKFIKNIWNKISNIFKKKPKEKTEAEIFRENIENSLFLVKFQYYQEVIAAGADPIMADVNSTKKTLDFYKSQISESMYINLKTLPLVEYCKIEDDFTFDVWNDVLDKCVKNENYEEAAIVSQKIEEYRNKS